jgi:hypothetical protein
MMNYEKRLINFLEANPNIRMTPHQIAGVWKRSKDDVRVAANILLNKRKIRETPLGALSLIVDCPN